MSFEFLFSSHVFHARTSLGLNQCPHTRFAGQKNNLYNGKG